VKTNGHKDQQLVASLRAEIETLSTEKSHNLKEITCLRNEIDQLAAEKSHSLEEIKLLRNEFDVIALEKSGSCLCLLFFMLYLHTYMNRSYIYTHIYTYV
jgi:hypothetical protein